jgi:hypothetical protein
MKRIDRDAMKRAIEEVRRKGGEDLRQIESMLASQPWEEVGVFAVYSCQDDNLHLEPWQVPPCWLRTDADVQAALSMPHDHTGRREAGELVQRLLAAGLSRYEPDPLTAVEAAEQRARQVSVKPGDSRQQEGNPNVATADRVER